MKQRVSLRLLLVGALLLVCTAALAQSPGSLVGRVAERTLDNGLTVLVLPREGAPVVALQMTYRVGGVDEPVGKSGMAHVLEHMLFKGTRTLGTRDWEAEKPLLEEIERVGRALDRERRSGGDEAAVAALSEELAALQAKHRPLVVKDEIDGIYARNGGVGFNASTSADLTNYVVSLPSNRLELWAAIESERMRDPVLREYYTERDVVLEERSQRRESRPGARLYEALLATAFAAHPYRDPVIGWLSDLETLDIADTREFYWEHYGPDNAVIVAVGDVKPESFFALVERYFGDQPAHEHRAPHPTREPVQEGPRRAEVHFDAEPHAVLAYHKPTLPHRDDYVLDVVDALLSDGRSARLTRELVDRRKLATSVSTVNGTPGARYDNLFALFVTPAPGVAVDEALDAVRAELQKLAAEPPAPEELEKVLHRMEASRVRALVSDVGLARRLAYFQAVAGDWRYIEEHPKVLATVTGEDVSEVAARTFVKTNETTVILHKKHETAAGEGAK